MKGKFITLEGTEGVGKSTNLEFIREFIQSKGIDLIVTREPGGTPLAEQLRSILLENRDEVFDPTAELLTVFAARAQHLNTHIKPALERGSWVLSDRFTDATYAYQGAGRGLDLELIQSLETIVQGALRPDCTFLLDIDVKLGLERARSRAALDRFENEQLEFFEKVRAAYLARANAGFSAGSSKYAVIDASNSLEKVQEDIRLELEKLFKAY